MPNQQWIQQQLELLAKQTESTKQSQKFKDFLNTMTKFWNYSFYNQLLIFNQFPQATKVTGFKTWQNLKRNVKKGEKAIQIFAPFTYKDENEEKTIKFQSINVFDISQTEGEELLELDISTKGKEQINLFNDLIQLCKQLEIELKFENLKDDLYGYTKDNFIVINAEHETNTQINTLLHEIAHVILHKDKKLNKNIKEIQAETVAYIIASYFGLSPKSFNYLALFDADYKTIMNNFEIISKTVKLIIEKLNNKN